MAYSNTTLVKVKLDDYVDNNDAYANSNTTLVKVKLHDLSKFSPTEFIFKYNSC